MISLEVVTGGHEFHGTAGTSARGETGCCQHGGGTHRHGLASAGSERLIKQRYLCFPVNRKLWLRGKEDFSFSWAAGSAGASYRRSGVCAQRMAPSSSCPAPLVPFPGRRLPDVCVKLSPCVLHCGRWAMGPGVRSFPCALGNPCQHPDLSFTKPICYCGSQQATREQMER